MSASTTPDFTASVVRADDLLVLTFAGFNLRLDTDGPDGPVLQRMDDDLPAVLSVVLPPQHTTEQIDGDGPAPAVMAAPSRLAFRLDPGVRSVPYTVATLLDWAAHTPNLTATALPSGPTGDQVAIPAEPAATETAIELPYRLVLSPDVSGGWNHATVPVTRNGITEVWHTRLGSGPSGSADPSTLPPLRAVWTRDFGSVSRPDLLNALLSQTVGTILQPEVIVCSTLGGGQRASLVVQTALISPDNPTSPLEASHLTLSALGGWTDVRGEWDPTAESPVPITAWRHVVAQGRDQSVRIVTRGSLYPLGHRADLTTVVERVLDPDGAERLHAQSTVVVRQPERDYDDPALTQIRARDAQLPLRRIRLETVQTPVLDFAFGTFLVSSGGSPFPFHAVGRDRIGQRVDMDMPLVFVPEGGDPGSAFDEANQVFLANQRVALAEPRSGSSTVLPVTSFTFAGESVDGTFLPYVDTARVRVPALDHLVASAAPPAAALISLLDPAANAHGIFARMVDEPVHLNLPTQRGGGLASPSMDIGALSTSLGAVPGGIDDLPLSTIVERVKADLDAARLLGTIPLSDVIGAITDIHQLPAVSHVEHDGEVDVVFDWRPPITSTGPLRVDPGRSVLSLRSTVHIPAGQTDRAPELRVEGRLTDFSLAFGDVASVAFESLEFTAQPGRPMDVRPRGVRLVLEQALQFLNVLADLLPKDGFAGGAAVRITPQSVTAGYAVGLPPAGVGILSLEQVALSASVVLPLDSRPAAVRLAFSERTHPFLVSVSGIGGSGYFALEVDTERVRRLEGAVEVGANITVDLAIVSANVHVMGGFYFGLSRVGDKDHIEFAAYLRIGGSVELLGIAGVSVDFVLSMSLELDDGRPVSVGGRASVVVAVHLLMFTKSVSLSTEKHFAIAAHDPTFDDLVDEADWETYCRAYA
jgi:hypothetical protein